MAAPAAHPDRRRSVEPRIRCHECQVVLAERVRGSLANILASVVCWRCAHPAYVPAQAAWGA